MRCNPCCERDAAHCPGSNNTCYLLLVIFTCATAYLPMQLHAVETCMFSTFSSLVIKHSTEPAVRARITYSIL